MDNFFLGIDVSKGYADFIMIDEKMQPAIDSFQLDDTYTGHRTLYGILEAFFKNHTDATIYAGVESTGGYENNWFSFLHKQQQQFPVFVTRLNPFGVSHDRKADMKRVITDKNSARAIATYLVRHHEQISYTREDFFAPMRKVWNVIKTFTKQRTELLNQLESLLYGAYPEILTYCKNGVPDWVLKLLQQYPTAQQVANAEVTSLTHIPYISYAKAARLHDSAQRSIGNADDMTADVIRTIVGQILHLSSIIAQRQKKLEASCSNADIKRLVSFTGIGVYSAVGLLIHIGPVERFASAKKVASFFGVHPTYKESGDGLWAVRMSKQGNAEVRSILFNVARCAVVHNPVIRKVYEHHIAKGMQHSKAMGACMHKILRIVYGMLKHGTDFNPAHGQQKQKTINNRQETTPDQLRRFQEKDTHAPISRRQYKKRKEQDVSQNE
jgi:transposase